MKPRTPRWISDRYKPTRTSRLLAAEAECRNRRTLDGLTAEDLSRRHKIPLHNAHEMIAEATRRRAMTIDEVAEQLGGRNV